MLILDSQKVFEHNRGLNLLKKIVAWLDVFDAIIEAVAKISDDEFPKLCLLVKSRINTIMFCQ
jgi:hypothetical protein